MHRYGHGALTTGRVAQLAGVDLADHCLDDTVAQMRRARIGNTLLPLERVQRKPSSLRRVSQLSGLPGRA